MLKNYLNSTLVDTDNLTIDINYKNVLKINKKRNEALKKGYLMTDRSDWVKGVASYKGEKYPLKIRLKGMLPNHWGQGDNLWSYKLNLKNDRTILGMKRFAVQHPRTRGYMNEWYFHEMMRYRGLIAPRYIFTPLTINGKKYPTFAIEENFDKRLIENNSKKEGPIFMLTERKEIEKNKKWFEVFHTISFYQEEYFKETTEGLNLLKRVERLVDGYMAGELKASDIFDLDLMAKAAAVTDLFGYDHSLQGQNIRFYLNPHTGLIEPIPFDHHEIYAIEKRGLLGEKFIHSVNNEKIKRNYNKSTKFPANYLVISRLFNDPIFSKKYIEELEIISSSKWLENFFDKVKLKAEKNISILHRSYPWYKFNPDLLYANRNFILSKLKPSNALRAFLLKASTQENHLSGHIANVHTLPIEIVAIKNSNGDLIHKFDKPYYLSNNPIKCEFDIGDCIESVPGKIEYIDFKFNFELPKNINLNDLIIVSKVRGTNNFIEDPLFKTSVLNESLLDIREFDLKGFFKIDEKNKLINIQNGEWAIKEKILIPKGYTLNIPSDTNIDLTNNAAIISYSPINMMGTYESPVLIYSSDNSGEGILILESEKTSNIINSKFKNLNSLNYEGLSFTGSFTAYESDINVENVVFESNHSEDAFNFVRSKVNLKNSKFIDIKSDAVDFDFCEANISNLIFTNIGNDGLDFSGSKAKANNIRMSLVGDKGISVGEKSNLYLSDIKIAKSFIGIASKDSSFINGNNIDIYDSNIGLASYQKKDEYGSGNIFVNSTNIKNTKSNYLSEINSKITLNENIMINNIEDFYEKVYK